MLNCTSFRQCINFTWEPCILVFPQLCTKETKQVQLWIPNSVHSCFNSTKRPISNNPLLVLHSGKQDLFIALKPFYQVCVPTLTPQTVFFLTTPYPLWSAYEKACYLYCLTVLDVEHEIIWALPKIDTCFHKQPKMLLTGILSCTNHHKIKYFICFVW